MDSKEKESYKKKEETHRDSIVKIIEFAAKAYGGGNSGGGWKIRALSLFCLLHSHLRINKIRENLFVFLDVLINLGTVLGIQTVNSNTHDRIYSMSINIYIFFKSRKVKRKPLKARLK